MVPSTKVVDGQKAVFSGGLVSFKLFEDTERTNIFLVTKKQLGRLTKLTSVFWNCTYSANSIKHGPNRKYPTYGHKIRVIHPSIGKDYKPEGKNGGKYRTAPRKKKARQSYDSGDEGGATNPEAEDFGGFRLPGVRTDHFLHCAYLTIFCRYIWCTNGRYGFAMVACW